MYQVGCKLNCELTCSYDKWFRQRCDAHCRINIGSCDIVRRGCTCCDTGLRETSVPSSVDADHSTETRRNLRQAPQCTGYMCYPLRMPVDRAGGGGHYQSINKLLRWPKQQAVMTTTHKETDNLPR